MQGTHFTRSCITSRVPSLWSYLPETDFYPRLHIILLNTYNNAKMTIPLESPPFIRPRFRWASGDLSPHTIHKIRPVFRMALPRAHERSPQTRDQLRVYPLASGRLALANDAVLAVDCVACSELYWVRCCRQGWADTLTYRKKKTERRHQGRGPRSVVRFARDDHRPIPFAKSRDDNADRKYTHTCMTAVYQQIIRAPSEYT